MQRRVNASSSFRALFVQFSRGTAVHRREKEQITQSTRAQQEEKEAAELIKEDVCLWEAQERCDTRL